MVGEPLNASLGSHEMVGCDGVTRCQVELSLRLAELLGYLCMYILRTTNSDSCDWRNDEGEIRQLRSSYLASILNGKIKVSAHQAGSTMARLTTPVYNSPIYGQMELHVRFKLPVAPKRLKSISRKLSSTCQLRVQS